jgi:hypothetical protein
MHQAGADNSHRSAALSHGQFQGTVGAGHIAFGRGKQRVFQRQAGQVANACYRCIEVHRPAGPRIDCKLFRLSQRRGMVSAQPVGEPTQCVGINRDPRLPQHAADSIGQRATFLRVAGDRHRVRSRFDECSQPRPGREA